MRHVPETATTASHGDDHGEHHIAPISLYFKIYGALLVLTVVTVGVSFAELGSASFAAAMVVAVIKAVLVAAFFMHLRYDDRLYTFIMIAAVVFVGLFFSFTYLDIFTRGNTHPQESNLELRRDKNWNEMRLNAAETAPLEAPAPADAVPGSPAPPAAPPAAP